MKLTKKKAIELSIELWTWLTETGKRKDEWDKWTSRVIDMCFLCEYGRQMTPRRFSCNVCPYRDKFGHCNNDGSNFNRWCTARTPKTRRKYAALFLEQLKSL